MQEPRTHDAIGDVLPEMLRTRGVSMRALASMIDMSPSHLSRALRGDERKHLSIDALEAIAAGLHVSPAYFQEYRTEKAVVAVRSDGALADRIYDASVGATQSDPAETAL